MSFVFAATSVLLTVLPVRLLRSVVVAVRAVLLAKLEAVPDSIPESVLNGASASLRVVTALLAILAATTASSANFPDVTLELSILAVVTASLCILAAATALSANSPLPIASSAISEAVIVLAAI